MLIGIQKCAISLRNVFYKQRHIFPEASSQETLPSHMRIEAIAMVYTLAMVQKIFIRVPSQDAKGKAQLSVRYLTLFIIFLSLNLFYLFGFK